MPYQQGHGIEQKQQQLQRHCPESMKIETSELKKSRKVFTKEFYNEDALSDEQINTQLGTYGGSLQKCSSFIKIASSRC